MRFCDTNIHLTFSAFFMNIDVMVHLCFCSFTICPQLSQVRQSVKVHGPLVLFLTCLCKIF